MAFFSPLFFVVETDSGKSKFGLNFIVIYLIHIENPYFYANCNPESFLPMNQIRSIAVILILQLSFFQYVKGQNSCLVTHYHPSTYAAGSQNWSLDMDASGFLYAANNVGLMKYDGVKWETYPLPSQGIVRSVSVAPDQKIYTGANNEFGYWEADSKGKLQYHSLVPLLKNFNLHNQEIWKIVQSDSKVYFQGFSSLFVYDGHTVKSIELPGAIIFLLKAGNRLFTQEVKGDLYELVNDRFVLLPERNIFSGTEVKAILPFGKNTFLIGTSSEGIFVYDSSGIRRWNAPANAQLKEYQINNGILFRDKIIFGTIVKGLFVLDKQGNVLNHLYSGNNLQNNTVLSLCNSADQNIWVGLDNGIDNISFGIPVDSYQDQHESLGAVYTAALYKNILYVGTNRGIFTYEQSGDKFNYQGFLANSQGQVWQLKVFGETLFCGHTNGTYVIDNLSLTKISDVSGGYMMQEMHIDGNDYLIQSTYSSLVLYQKSGNSWKYMQQIDGFMEPSRFIETDHLGNIWVGHQAKGLYRLKLAATLNKITEKQILGKSDGLLTENNVKVYKIANRVVFSAGRQLYTWDDLTQKIIPYTELNKKLGSFSKAEAVVDAGENKYWFANTSEAALFKFQGNQINLFYRIILDQFNYNMVDGYENIVPLTDKMHLICLDNGFAIFHEDLITRVKEEMPKLVMREITCRSASGDERVIKITDGKIRLANAYNNILISFTTSLDPCSRKLYQFRLEGIDTAWSNWTENAFASYTRLPVGSYQFQVRTLSVNGLITNPESFTLIVKPAWYLSVPAMVLYLMFIIGGILTSQYLYRKRIARHHENLRKVDEEKRLLENRQNEKEIIHLQNEKLQAEIAHKNMQLADSTMSIIRKNEVLIEIKTELEKQKSDLGARYPARYLERITTLIDRNISNDNDWEIFEALFDQAHENFFKRLKQAFPDLTQSDLKLCAYLKLNLSSKEIAPLLNISIRGVEIRRYRLRKRLGLSAEENLVEYIMQF